MNLLIDNYDSFSYNLYQLAGCIDSDIEVMRNDAFTIKDLERLALQHIIIGPGPGYPAAAGRCIEVVRRLGASVPILGVCLGHQAICEAYGARIGHAAHLMHGKQSQVTLDEACPLFVGLPTQIQAARYHSLAVREGSLPSRLKVRARADDGEIMAVQHEAFPVYGVQFHPESIMTPDGFQIMKNFLEGGAR